MLLKRGRKKVSYRNIRIEEYEDGGFWMKMDCLGELKAQK
jgi:hypothetical protein